MANYKPVDPGFKLIPFIQNKTNSVSFFLISPYNDKTVLNFFIDLEDYVCPDVFFDILSVAVDSLMPKEIKPSNKSGPARIKQAVKNIL
jgi:two-component SAPR family response regulator